MNSAVEESPLQQQQLCQEVSAMEERCASLLRDARTVEDRVQQAYEERLQEHKDFIELKEKIQQACEAQLEEYKGQAKLKEKVYKETFCMFASSFNQGLKVARVAPSAPLTDLRALELNSDGEEDCYGEDDNLLPKNPLSLSPRLQEGYPVNDLVSYAPPSLAASVTHFNGVGKE